MFVNTLGATIDNLSIDNLTVNLIAFGAPCSDSALTTLNCTTRQVPTPEQKLSFSQEALSSLKAKLPGVNEQRVIGPERTPLFLVDT